MERLFEMVIISELFHDSLVQRKSTKAVIITRCVKSLISALCLMFHCGRGESPAVRRALDAGRAVPVQRAGLDGGQARG